jgi:type III pantothenate kinase
VYLVGMLLAIDNSNHTTKLALAGASGWVEGSLRRLPSAGLDPRAILEALPSEPDIHAVAWASVTRGGPEILQALARELRVKSIAVSPATVPLDFTSYAAPETIGPDRLANVVAAAARFPGEAAIAIDAGTAITFSIIRPSGTGHPVFLGGAIAPGLGVLAGWPAERTARLPVLEFPATAPAPIGAGTREALAAGSWFGAIGMVREILAEQSRRLVGQAKVIVTGSDGALVAGWLGEEAVFDPWLTLEGIRLCGSIGR